METQMPDVDKMPLEELKAFQQKLMVARGYQRAIREILLYLKGRLDPNDGHMVNCLEEMSEKVANLKTFEV